MLRKYYPAEHNLIKKSEKKKQWWLDENFEC